MGREVIIIDTERWGHEIPFIIFSAFLCLKLSVIKAFINLSMQVMITVMIGKNRAAPLVRSWRQLLRVQQPALVLTSCVT